MLKVLWTNFSENLSTSTAIPGSFPSTRFLTGQILQALSFYPFYTYSQPHKKKSDKIYPNRVQQPEVPHEVHLLP